MRARILARKSNPGNRGGLHYSQFRRYLATRASQIQLLAFRPRRENRRPLSPIREVGLTPSGVLAENHPKNRGFVGILWGQKCHAPEFWMSLTFVNGARGGPRRSRAPRR